MTPTKPTILLTCILAGTAVAATPLDPPNAQPGVPSDELNRMPKNAYESTPALGLPYSSLFRNTGAPYYNSLRDLRATPEVRASETLGITSNIDLPDFRGHFPLLQRGFAPENADLKIGPMYFKLRQLSAGVLWSDNVRHRDTNRESDTIGIASIGGQILFQLTEGFHLGAAGNFVWLPFDNQAGVTGFSLSSPYSFGLAGTPNARAQAAWEPVVFGIPWVIANEFTVGLGRFTNNVHDGFEIYEGFELDDPTERSGIYYFRAPVNRNGGGGEFRDRDNEDLLERIYYSNEVSAATSARIIGDNLFRFRVAHENLWYEDDDLTGLPNVRDTALVGIESVRESLRFKPYVRYNYLHRDNPDRYYHRGRVGVKGPVTDLIQFRGDVGYLWEQERNHETTLWTARLDHIVNPRTRHSAEWSRDVSEFFEEVDQRVRYRFTHTLGPGLLSEAYAGYHWVEDLDGITADREELRIGSRLSWQYSPRTTLRLWGQYSTLDYENNSYSHRTWRGRAELSHRLYDKLNTRLIYQYTNREAEGRAESYYENLVYFTLSYLFQ